MKLTKRLLIALSVLTGISAIFYVIQFFQEKNIGENFTNRELNDDFSVVCLGYLLLFLLELGLYVYLDKKEPHD